MKKGDAADRVEAGVVDELAGELIEGRGLGLILRAAKEDEPAPASPPPALRPVFSYEKV